MSGGDALEKPCFVQCSLMLSTNFSCSHYSFNLLSLLPLHHLDRRAALHGVFNQTTGGGPSPCRGRCGHAQPERPPLLVDITAQEPGVAQGERIKSEWLIERMGGRGVDESSGEIWFAIMVLFFKRRVAPLLIENSNLVTGIRLQCVAFWRCSPAPFPPQGLSAQPERPLRSQLPLPHGHPHGLPQALPVH